MEVFRITLFCLCAFLVSAVSGKSPPFIHPCIPNPCEIGTCYPLHDGNYWCQVGCYHNGIIYKPGATFWIDCNLCLCHKNGLISCTKKNCGYCTYKGKSYKPGSVIKIGCVVCHCLNGNWVCNLIVPCKEELKPELSQKG